MRNSAGVLVKVLTEPWRYVTGWAADVEHACGKLYNTLICPIGDWRVGDVLEDIDGVILEITAVGTKDNKPVYDYKFVSHSGTGTTTAIFDKLKPRFRPKPDQTHKVKIECPSCKAICDAVEVKRHGEPFASFVHTCDCGYVITESEWREVDTTAGHIADIRKIVTDGLNEILKKIEEVQ